MTFSNETLNYVIQYKWGLVQKDAATAKLRLSNRANDYHIMLTAATKSWADGIFPVRDTLISTITKSNFRPVSYTKITHENKKYRKDILSYTFSGKYAYGTCTRYKKNPGGPTYKNVIKCSAKGSAFDMLSIFYFVRRLDFEKMLTGKKVVKTNIFSGSNPEVITIKCVGKSNVKLPSGKKYPCYQLQFTFTTNGRRDTSAPMNVWISTDPQHIPVKLVGTLPIGQVRCFLTSTGK